jgi:uncharacterized protein
MMASFAASGKQITLHQIDADAIDIEDIAHHLAQLNRYAGACVRPYCVAEHSLFVCDILAANGHGSDWLLLKAALLHDAHEAYCTDLPTPIKQLIGGAWCAAESAIEHQVRARFDVAHTFAQHTQTIEWADRVALATEWPQLMPHAPPLSPHDHPSPVNWINFADQAKFSWQDWRDAFLDRFADYQYGAQLATHSAHT